MDVSRLWFAVVQASLDGGDWFLWVPTALGLLLAIYPILYVASKPDSLATKGLTEPKQLISGKGFRLEISTLSLLVLSGVILALTGVAYKVYFEYEDLSNLKKAKERLEDEVQKVQKITVTIYLRLPGGGKAPLLSTLRCRYKADGPDHTPDYVAGQIYEGSGDYDVGCKIADIGREDVTCPQFSFT